jgi:hypothetical protein
MGVRWPGNANTALLTNSCPPVSATAVLTTAPLNFSIDGALAVLLWYLLVEAPANAGDVVVGLLRGSGIAGAVVNRGALRPLVPSAVQELAGVYTDSPGAAAEQQWTLVIAVGWKDTPLLVLDGCIAALAL